MAKSHRNDPITSHRAAVEVEDSGRATSHRAICLDHVRSQPGQTAAEIAVAVNLERHAPSRRLPELREQGLITNGQNRICQITGRQSIIWIPNNGDIE